MFRRARPRRITAPAATPHREPPPLAGVGGNRPFTLHGCPATHRRAPRLAVRAAGRDPRGDGALRPRRRHRPVCDRGRSQHRGGQRAERTDPEAGARCSGRSQGTDCDRRTAWWARRFEFNPTNCDPLSVTGALKGYEGGQRADCVPVPGQRLCAAAFPPNAQGEHAGSSEPLERREPRRQSHIARARASEPREGRAAAPEGAALAPDDDPESLPRSDVRMPTRPTCDEGSVIGTAIVHTPVLDQPLTGPAYLVSHGNAAFPDVEFVLQGEGITLVLDGKTDIKKGITYSSIRIGAGRACRRSKSNCRAVRTPPSAASATSAPPRSSCRPNSSGRTASRST